MRTSVGVVRNWRLSDVDGEREPMNAASLVKLIIGHLALFLVFDLDAPIHDNISTRHVLSHTTGLPNWRPAGRELTPLRPPGVRWGYSGEGFVLLQSHLEHLAGQPIDELAARSVFEPLGVTDSRFERPEPGFHGYRPLFTTAGDFGRFLAHVLALDDERWRPQVGIDSELAWGAGWGLELSPLLHGWQWGQNPDAGNFVIGRPKTGSGVVVFTDDPNGGRPSYRGIVEEHLPGDHPSLRVEHNPTFLALTKD